MSTRSKGRKSINLKKNFTFRGLQQSRNNGVWKQTNCKLPAPIWVICLNTDNNSTIKQFTWTKCEGPAISLLYLCSSLQYKASAFLTNVNSKKKRLDLRQIQQNLTNGTLTYLVSPVWWWPSIISFTVALKYLMHEHFTEDCISQHH